ncbi:MULTISPECIES: response regulator transcription factor [Mucilaginibacter]|uniref:response regulator transcription factor n=1 Tax=Mucilaginibacter TaxID=423349 RepID=UPI000871A950|nr:MULTISPECIES: response regulator transcription factor [Mucilaginibacter]NVM67248.1 DNA-binding NarL/FixJ family response regulator [Mucilaginibacter sp. SG538B]GGB17890.1 DNA-binding response regulator [Mucilaginibacter rubeus]SCW80646.1 two component transcriptional regulator, LuxR family [Mucilaginibacter sp. NFR10]
MKITVGIADDQQLFLRSLSGLINSFDNFVVVVEALNGAELLRQLTTLDKLPDIVLIDVQMPVMDGPATVSRIAERFPLIKTAALSMKEDDHSILSMLRAGCSAYLLKDVHPKELETALLQLSETGFYNGDTFRLHYRRLLRNQEEMKFTDREKQFLTLACSDFTYKEIASKMFLSEKTIDGYRESLFSKLNVKSRTGMALEGIKLGLVELKTK